MHTRREGAPCFEEFALVQPEAGYPCMMVYSVPRWRTARRQGERYLPKAGGLELSIWTLPISVGGLEEVR